MGDQLIAAACCLFVAVVITVGESRDGSRPDAPFDPTGFVIPPDLTMQAGGGAPTSHAAAICVPGEARDMRLMLNAVAEQETWNHDGSRGRRRPECTAWIWCGFLGPQALRTALGTAI
jgi:hypothetical protein